MNELMQVNHLFWGGLLNMLVCSLETNDKIVIVNYVKITVSTNTERVYV